MAILGSFLRPASDFAPRVRAPNSVNFHPISKNKVPCDSVGGKDKLRARNLSLPPTESQGTLFFEIGWKLTELGALTRGAKSLAGRKKDPNMAITCPNFYIFWWYQFYSIDRHKLQIITGEQV